MIPRRSTMINATTAWLAATSVQHALHVPKANRTRCAQTKRSESWCLVRTSALTAPMIQTFGWVIFTTIILAENAWALQTLPAMFAMTKQTVRNTLSQSISWWWEALQGTAKPVNGIMNTTISREVTSVSLSLLPKPLLTNQITAIDPVPLTAN